jgi:UDP-N-acetylmuramoylalanine--D-glutamate ligase
VDNNAKYLVVLGAGESGVGAALLGKNRGWRVFVSDKGTIQPEFKAELEHENIAWEEGEHSLERFEDCDLVVKSPGIPDHAASIQHLRSLGKKIVSEIEFAGGYLKGKVIGITGSNGKTTTAMLTYHILKKAGLDVVLAGNVGKSLARVLAIRNYDWYVVELSSFQLDGMFSFKVDIAILTNITPDHLDRYEYNMELYSASKFRILQNQTPDSWLIYNADDPTITNYVMNSRPVAQCAPFSMRIALNEGGYADEQQLTINIKEQFTMSIHELALKGKHNTQNSLASGIAARILEIRKEIVRESLEDFVNVEHRLEFVAKVHGIEFINDSKATNVNSTWFALESMEHPTVWIVGGVDKGNDYAELLPLVKDKVKAIVCLGTDNRKLLETFSESVEQIVEAKNAAEAVAFGYNLAQNGDTVLLSPACASFDLFEDYEDRGNQFKAAVRSL